jgi:hypothetical protein
VFGWHPPGAAGFKKHIGFKTVQAFRARIIEKLGLSGATELLTEAIRWHDSQSLK